MSYKNIYSAKIFSLKNCLKEDKLVQSEALKNQMTRATYHDRENAKNAASKPKPATI
jgi:hypothetical protein